MADVLVILAHPDMARSRVNRALAGAARALPAQEVEVRDLYALYPDFVIDIEAEQACLQRARTVVWVHPFHWYGMPALMKLWVDDVFAFGWAYGHAGHALAGKCLWLVVSTGGPESAYSEHGNNARPFSAFLPPYMQTAALVGMTFLEPTVFHGAHRSDDAHIRAHAERFAGRLQDLVHEARAAGAPPLPAIADDERPGPSADAPPERAAIASAGPGRPALAGPESAGAAR